MNNLLLESNLAPDLWHQIFNFANYPELLALVRNSIIAGAVLGLVGGLVSSFVMMRDLPFAVHGVSELSFAGAAGALLLGVNVIGGSLIGSILAALLIGALGSRARDRNSIIGGPHAVRSRPRRAVPGALPGPRREQVRTAHRTDRRHRHPTAAVADRDRRRRRHRTPRALAPADVRQHRPELAAARGVPVNLLSPAFMLLLGLAVAISIQIIGALLVLSVICTPAAAAMRITASPRKLPLLSMLFGLVAVVGGILLALGSSVPISPYVTTISFTTYLACRLIGNWRGRHGRSHRVTRGVAEPAVAHAR